MELTVSGFVWVQLDEKARLEAEARELEVQQQLLKEQRMRQQEEEAALKQELLRLQEMQQLRASKKKKKDNKVKELTKSENPSLVPTTNNPQPLQQTAQSVLEKNMQNGKTQLLHNLIRLSPREPRLEPESPNGGKNGPLQQPSPKTCKERPSESPALQNGTCSHPESSHTKVKHKQQANGSKPNGEATKRPAETSKDPEPPKAGNIASPQTDAKARQKASDESVTEIKRDERFTGKKPQNGGKDERNSPVIEFSALDPSQQNSKIPNNESPQPKSKAKKNKKKKADKMNNTIGECCELPNCLRIKRFVHFWMENQVRTLLLFNRWCISAQRHWFGQRRHGRDRTRGGIFQKVLFGIGNVFLWHSWPFVPQQVNLSPFLQVLLGLGATDKAEIVHQLVQF